MLTLTTFSVLVVLAVIGLVGMSYWVYHEGQELAREMQKAVSAKIIERNQISARTSVLESKYSRIQKEHLELQGQKNHLEANHKDLEEERDRLEGENTSMLKELEISRKVNDENQEILSKQEADIEESFKIQSDLEDSIKSLREEKNRLMKEAQAHTGQLVEEKNDLEKKLGQIKSDFEKLSQDKEDELHDRFLIITGLKAEKSRISAELKKQINGLQSQLNAVNKDREEVREQWQHVDQQLEEKQREFESAKKNWLEEKQVLEAHINEEVERLQTIEKLYYEASLLQVEKEQQTILLIENETKEKESLQTSIDELNGKLEEQKNQYRETKNRFEESLDEMLATHRMEVEEESKKSQELGRRVEKLGQELSQSKKLIEEKSDFYKRLQEELDRKIQALETDLLDQEEMTRLAREEAEGFKTKNKNIEEQIEALKKEKTELEAEFKKVQSAKAELEEEARQKLLPVMVEEKTVTEKAEPESPPIYVDFKTKVRTEEEKPVRRPQSKKSKKQENIFESMSTGDDSDSNGLTYFEKKLMKRVLKAQAIILKLEEENHRLKKQLKKSASQEPSQSPDLAILKEKIDEARRSLYLIQSEQEWDEVG